MRAQVALEYVTMTGFALILVIGLLYTALAVQQRTNRQAGQEELQNIANELQQELLLAASVHDGYTRTFELPEQAASFDYWISNYSSSFTVHMTGYSEQRRTPPYTGAPGPGENTLTKVNGSIAFT